MIASVQKWKSTSSKQKRRGDALSGAVQAKVVLQHVENFRDACMCPKCAEVVWDRYKTDATNLEVILSLSEQRTLMQKLDIDRTSSTLDTVVDKEGDCDFKSMATAEEVATSCIRGRLGEV